MTVRLCLRLLIKKNHSAAAMIASPTTPPTVPPAIAPTGVPPSSLSSAGSAVGVLELVMLELGVLKLEDVGSTRR